MARYIFDGQIYAQRITGTYRYADEILREFDKLINKDEYEIVVPEYVDLTGKFKNLKVTYYGNIKGIMWTQISFAIYLIKNKAIGIGFCNTTPIIRPGIAVIHDIGYKVLENHYKNIYGRLSSLWHRLNYWVIAKGNKRIITVSRFSKQQIEDVYRVNDNRISVIGNGWQHYNRIIADENIFDEQVGIIRGNYYFAMGSLEERKNFKWIMEVAKRNPTETFVIAGGAVKNAKDKIDFNNLENVHFIGYISDGYAKALMRYAKAFLFPSTFEGFGIPPLEALSVDTKVLCANSSCLPEICGDAVAYFDAYDYDVDLEKLIASIDEGKREYVLGKYCWGKSAEKLKDFLNNIDKCI